MKLRITLAQIYPKLGNVECNIEKHIQISEKIKDKTQLLIFPELSLTGFNLMDLVPDVALEKSSESLNRLAEITKDLDIILGLVESDKGCFYNSAFYYSNSSLKYIQRKLFLSYPRGLSQSNYFFKGNAIKILDTDWGKVGILISDDALNPIGLFPFIKERIDILIIISNSLSCGFSPNKGLPKSALMWKNLVSLYAQMLSCYVIYVNRVGFEDGLNFFGGSCIVDPYGELLLSCPYYEESLADIELELCPFRFKPFNLSFDLDRLELIAKGLRYEP